MPKARKRPLPAKPRAVNRKSIEARLRRLEELMARLNQRKREIEARLAEPAAYADPQALQELLADQAYVARELEQVESEWLQKQAELEQP